MDVESIDADELKRIVNENSPGPLVVPGTESPLRPCAGTRSYRDGCGDGKERLISGGRGGVANHRASRGQRPKPALA